jgi:hypothetical protein
MSLPIIFKLPAPSQKITSKFSNNPKKINTLKALFFATISLGLLGILALNFYQQQDQVSAVISCPDLKVSTSTAVKCIRGNDVLFLKSRSSVDLQVANGMAGFIGLSVLNEIDVTKNISPDLQRLFEGSPVLATTACKLKFLDDYAEAYSYYPKVLFLGLGDQHAGNVQRNVVTNEVMFIDLDASAITDAFSLIRPFLQGRDPAHDLFYDYIPSLGDLVKTVLACVEKSQDNLKSVEITINDPEKFKLFQEKLLLFQDILTRYPEENPSILWTVSKEFKDFESLLPTKIEKFYDPDNSFFM